MSQVTTWLRAHGDGPILDAVEGVIPHNVAQQLGQEASAVATVAINGGASLVASIFQAQIASRFGSGATFAVDTFDAFLGDFVSLLESKLPAVGAPTVGTIAPPPAG